MNVTLTPFCAEDGLELLGAGAGKFVDLLIKLECDGPGWTGRLPDGRILGAAGMTQIVPWVADFWLIPSKWVPDYPLAFHRTVLGKFKELLAQSTAVRIQGVVDPKYPERVRWIERLGFTREGTMRTFGPNGEDMDLYAIIRGHSNGS